MSSKLKPPLVKPPRSNSNSPAARVRYALSSSSSTGPSTLPTGGGSEQEHGGGGGGSPCGSTSGSTSGSRPSTPTLRQLMEEEAAIAYSVGRGKQFEQQRRGSKSEAEYAFSPEGGGGGAGGDNDSPGGRYGSRAGGGSDSPGHSDDEDGDGSGGEGASAAAAAAALAAELQWAQEDSVAGEGSWRRGEVSIVRTALLVLGAVVAVTACVYYSTRGAAAGTTAEEGRREL